MELGTRLAMDLSVEVSTVQKNMGMGIPNTVQHPIPSIRRRGTLRL
jgi:hypothetical protein